MQVRNTLKSKETTTAAGKNEVCYNVGGETVRITPQIVKNYLVTGNPENVTMQEVVMYMNLCKHAKLNPWMKEAYCIKYGSQPATMVVGKDAYFKRADACPTYDGIESGLIVLSDAGIQYRQGAFYLPNDEEIVGAWAEVYRSDKAHPYRVEVSFSEYVGKKKDGTVNGQWASKPATMIVKVAEVQALRKAFPGTLGQLYVAEEKGVEEPAAEFGEVIQSDQEPQKTIEAAETPTETTTSPTETVEPSQGTFFA